MSENWLVGGRGGWAGGGWEWRAELLIRGANARHSGWASPEFHMGARL